MENTQLAQLIDDAQNLLNATIDLEERIHDPNGTFAKLEEIGVQSRYMKRDVVSLNIHFKLFLKIARGILGTWVVDKQKESNENN